VNWAYWWSYKFIQWVVWILAGGLIGVLMFVGLSAGIVARHTRKHVKEALTVAQLNRMSQGRGGET
jgi:hypothetical protein